MRLSLGKGNETMSNPTNGETEAHEEPLSDEEIEEFLRHFEGLQEDFKTIVASYDAQTVEWRRKMAGPHLEVLLQSPGDTLRYCVHPDPNLRQLAIHLAIYHWRFGKVVAGLCERMALTDADSAVRNAATGALGVCYRDTKDPRIGCFLATIALDESKPRDVRKTAYMALLLIHGRNPTAPFPSRRFPEDVDWSFVKDYFRRWKIDNTAEVGDIP
jgi:hypothetical protein